MPGDTWREIVGPQALDVIAVTAFLGLALVSFLRKSVGLKYVTFVAALLYMGFLKSRLVSVVDILGIIDGTLPIVRYNLAWYVVSAFVLISTILWGRLYCGRMCAFGALTQLMDAMVPQRVRVDVPKRVEQAAGRIKYGVLVAVVLYFITTKDMTIYRYVEPFWMFGLSGTTAMWIGLSVLLLGTVFVRNVYCRFLCPVGAFLGILSHLTVFRIKRWSECRTCKICEKACQWGAIKGPTIVASECVRCDDCERLYRDQRKCPHWIILQRRTAAGLQPVRLTRT